MLVSKPDLLRPLGWTREGKPKGLDFTGLQKIGKHCTSFNSKSLWPSKKKNWQKFLIHWLDGYPRKDLWICRGEIWRRFQVTKVLIRLPLQGWEQKYVRTDTFYHLDTGVLCSKNIRAAFQHLKLRKHAPCFHHLDTKSSLTHSTASQVRYGYCQSPGAI